MRECSNPDPNYGKYLDSYLNIMFCESGSKLDPYSAPLWIRIPNSDPDPPR